MKNFEFLLLERIDKSLTNSHAALRILARDLDNPDLAEAVKHIDKAVEKVCKVLAFADIEWGT